MECRKCGAPAVDGAVYCGVCGARVDGKKECASCGKFNDENYAFCIYCGARIDGKTACSSCGTVHEGNFCPACGQAGAKPTSAAKQKKAKAKGGKSLFVKICSIIGDASMMLGVLLSVIFVFLIGLVMVQDGETVEKVNIFTFFGEYYKDMDALNVSDMGLTNWWEELIEGQSTLYGVFGTILSAATLLCTVGFAVVAIVKYILSWTRKTENKANGWALASVLSFLAGAIFFYGYVGGDVLIEGLSSLGVSNIGMETRFNGATVTAIVLCLVFVAVSIVLTFLCKGKEPWTGKNLIGTVCAFVGVAFAGVMLAMSQFADFGFSMSAAGALAGISADSDMLELLDMLRDINLEMFSGFGLFNTSANMEFAQSITADLGAELYNALTSALSTMNAFNVIAQISVFALTVCSVLSLYANINGAQGGKSRSILWSACAVGASVLLLVFHILAWSKFKYVIGGISGDYDVVDKMLDGKFGVSICAVIFSLLLLGVSIVRTVFMKKAENED